MHVAKSEIVEGQHHHEVMLRVGREEGVCGCGCWVGGREGGLITCAASSMSTVSNPDLSCVNIEYPAQESVVHTMLASLSTAIFAASYVSPESAWEEVGQEEEEVEEVEVGNGGGSPVRGGQATPLVRRMGMRRGAGTCCT